MVERKKILVIDDEPNITRVINHLLSQNNFEVKELNDSAKLEDHILYADYDAIITDLNMPLRNGFEIISIIRRSKPNIPVIVLTGEGTMDSTVESMKLGAVAFLTKPLDSENLLAAVNKHTHVDAYMTTKMKNFLAKKLPQKSKSSLKQEKILLKNEIVSTDSIPAGFVEVEFEGVLPGEKIPFDIFIQIYDINKDKHYLRLLCKADTEYTSGLKNILYQRGLASVFIYEKDYRIFFSYYSKLKRLTGFQGEIIKDNKKMILYGKAVEAINQILTMPIDDKSIKQASVLVDGLFKAMVKDPDIFQDMYLLFKHDTTIYTHSANVCLLATSFGVFMGFAPDYINVLSMGALFHDIGLNKVDKTILEKQTPLTKSEWAEIKEHPARGLKILQSSLLFPVQSLRIISEHHENSDGSGYPNGLRANQISSLSRLMRIVDKYDSLTSIKPYRAAFTPSQAFREIYREETLPKPKIMVQKFLSFLAGRKPESPALGKALMK